MTIYNLVEEHRSIRKYLPKSVPEDLLHRILKAAMQSSSSGNMQAYSVIVSKSKELKKKLYPLHFNQSMVKEAPVFLTFCADFNRKRKWLKLNNAQVHFDNMISFMIASIDAILYSQNVSLLAESEGLGVCYLGTTLANCDKIAEVLKCPQNVVPVVGFSLGYPDEKPKPRQRLPLDGIIHQETYQDYTSEKIKLIYKDKEEMGWERYRENETFKEKIDELGIENLAQVYTHLKYTESSHIEYSSALYNCLKRQNFT